MVKWVFKTSVYMARYKNEDNIKYLYKLNYVKPQILAKLWEKPSINPYFFLYEIKSWAYSALIAQIIHFSTQ